MWALDADVARDLFECTEDLESVRVHLLVALAEAVVGIDLLVALEGLVQDQDEAFDDGAVFERVDVAGVNDLLALAHLGTRPVAEHALSVHSLRKQTHFNYNRTRIETTINNKLPKVC